jgi:hypothetical protein
MSTKYEYQHSQIMNMHPQFWKEKKKEGVV